MQNGESEPAHLRIYAVSHCDEISYKSNPDQQNGFLLVQRALSIAEFKQGIDAGGRIEHVAVVFTDPEKPGGGQFVPYLRPSWRPEYCAIRLYKSGSGLRGFRSFDPLLGQLAEFGYLAPLVVLRDGDPAIAADYRIGVDQPASE